MAEAAARTNYGTYRLGAAEFNGRTTYQAEASGGLAAIGGGVYASRRIDSSFALVDVAGMSNVRVYNQNQLVGRTDADGRLLVPQLLAYQANTLRVDPADLPLDARIADLSQNAAPYFRSGTVTRFPISRARSATLTVRDASGQPLPAGTELVADDGKARFPVGYEGFTYLTDLRPGRNRFHVAEPAPACSFVVTYPEASEVQPDLGVIRCEVAAP